MCRCIENQFLLLSSTPYLSPFSIFFISLLLFHFSRLFPPSFSFLFVFVIITLRTKFLFQILLGEVNVSGKQAKVVLKRTSFRNIFRRFQRNQKVERKEKEKKRAGQQRKVLGWRGEVDEVWMKATSGKPFTTNGNCRDHARSSAWPSHQKKGWRSDI